MHNPKLLADAKAIERTLADWRLPQPQANDSHAHALAELATIVRQLVETIGGPADGG